MAGPLVDYLAQATGVSTSPSPAATGGGRETVGDLDILVTCDDSAAVMKRFTYYPEVDEVVSQGPSRATVYLRSGLQVDLRVVPAKAMAPR